MTQFIEIKDDTLRPPEAYRFSEHDLSTPDGRLAYFCARFEVEAPEIERDENGHLEVSGPLLKWSSENGVSLDWLFMGEVGGALALYREYGKKVFSCSKQGQ